MNRNFIWGHRWKNKIVESAVEESGNNENRIESIEKIVSLLETII